MAHYGLAVMTVVNPILLAVTATGSLYCNLYHGECLQKQPFASLS